MLLLLNRERSDPCIDRYETNGSFWCSLLSLTTTLVHCLVTIWEAHCSIPYPLVAWLLAWQRFSVQGFFFCFWTMSFLVWNLQRVHHALTWILVELVLCLLLLSLEPSRCRNSVTVDSWKGDDTGLDYDLQSLLVKGVYVPNSHSGKAKARRSSVLGKKDTGLNYTWPLKRVAIVDGDIILGGLMMVHERKDATVCGPIMPQGGIQALEAALFTLDYINGKSDFLPGIKIGAHILDDCDKDTYGLEQAVDFIKGKKQVWNCFECPESYPELLVWTAMF